MIDPKLFTVEKILATMFDDCYGNRDTWRKHCEIITNFMPRYPQPDTKPKCVVKCGDGFLRYSKGPRQGFLWDTYGDDFLTPELALMAILDAPVPPFYLKDDEEALSSTYGSVRVSLPIK